MIAAMQPLDGTHRRPSQPLPEFAADCHMHVFGPFERFPLAAAPHVWVKLAGADRITRASGKLRDAIPFMRALAAVAPGRLVWGSDWPHIGFHPGEQVQGGELLPYRGVDAGELLDVLIEAFPDARARHAILAANPARLYGFNG
jgi:predicted TIM-barrel fold metal-dependent hydrolase